MTGTIFDEWINENLMCSFTLVKKKAGTWSYLCLLWWWWRCLLTLLDSPLKFWLMLSCIIQLQKYLDFHLSMDCLFLSNAISGYKIPLTASWKKDWFTNHISSLVIPNRDISVVIVILSPFYPTYVRDFCVVFNNTCGISVVLVIFLSASRSQIT